MRSRGWRFQWLAVAVVVALGLAALGVAQTAAGRSLLRGAGLTSAPPRYTELAFTHPKNLPDKLQHGRGRLVAPLAVHNLEGSRQTYRWVASEQKLDGRASQLDSGTVTVPSGRWGSVKPRLDVACGDSLRVYVKVALERPSQSIGFWVECPRGLIQQWKSQQMKGGLP